MTSQHPQAAADGLRARAGGAWTREKLVYLSKYAKAFMTAMNPKRRQGLWQQLVYIDPLCGPGVDIDGRTGEEFQGSPLIAVETKPLFDRLYFGDKNRSNVEALRARISVDNLGRVSLVQSDCHQRVRSIVEEISTKTLGLAFVDPEGFEVHFELFRTLSKRSIDIVFLFPSAIGIRRNISQFVKADHSRMDDLWGSRQWRQTALARLLATSSVKELPDEQVDRSWVRAFCERVATLGYTHFDAVGPLRNEQNVPMYHLLFFSKNQAGLTIWRGIGRIGPKGQRSLPW